ncbi:MAG TPA: GTP cyclohydrolase FolE2 [Verrucomicrobiota bacterium]|nr:GTP cyclohydrolase FolE2 [Verrucomicrobiota bacterium]
MLKIADAGVKQKSRPSGRVRSKCLSSFLCDKQNERDHRDLRIDKVGVRGLHYPIQVLDKAHELQNTIATIGMYVDLPKEFKGTHMSRFIEVLEAHGGIVHVNNIPDILAAMQEKLKAATAHLEMEFPYFLTKHAPVSGLSSVMDYTARFIATACGREIDFILGVLSPVTTLCPCSKAISRYSAHNQRGVVTVHLRSPRTIWIEDVIAMVESSASCDLYALLKREDEKEVTERAYENPVFVEDLVRNVAQKLKAHPDVSWFKVEAENHESIHNHNAYACIESHPAV